MDDFGIPHVRKALLGYVSKYLIYIFLDGNTIIDNRIQRYPISSKPMMNTMGYTSNLNYLRIFGGINGYATGSNPQKLE